MRDAQSLLEQVLAFAQPTDGTDKSACVDESLLQEILGLAERRILYQLSAAVLGGDAQRCVELVAMVVNQGSDPNRFSRDLVEHFRNLLVARLAEDGRNVGGGQRSLDDWQCASAGSSDQEIADLRSKAQHVSVEMLLDYFDSWLTVTKKSVARPCRALSWNRYWFD